MKNCQYVLDIETPFIRKLYDKEDNYKVELLTPYGILEELKKLQEENANMEQQLSLTEKALELACEELYDSDSISICAYCPYDIQDECADECPQNTKVLEKYFKTKAKEMMKSE